MTSLAEKLHPDRFTEMSPLMAAIAGYVLGESWTDPKIAEIAVINGDISVKRSGCSFSARLVIGCVNPRTTELLTRPHPMRPTRGLRDE